MNERPAPGQATLRISRIHYPVTVLGHGTRLGIWVQGCPLACRGCIATDTWPGDGGTEVTVGELAGLWRQAVARGADGVTVSGGEPLAQPVGLATLLTAIAEVRAELTDASGVTTAPPHRELDIFVYTGYEPPEFTESQRQAIEPADVLVTGRFVASAPTRLIWRGSANQQLTLRTALARRRYEHMLDHAPAQAPMQLRVEGTGAWLIGVPRVGETASFERLLRDQGIRPSAVSWRPRSSAAANSPGADTTESAGQAVDRDVEPGLDGELASAPVGVPRLKVEPGEPRHQV